MSRFKNGRHRGRAGSRSGSVRDELRLLVHPVAARHGERLFDEGEDIQPLRLLRSDVFPTGVVRLCYAPAELPGAQAYEDVTDKVPGAGDDPR